MANTVEISTFQNLTEELEGESDRALAVLAAAYLDFLLGEILILQMKVSEKKARELLLNGESGVISTFSAKIRLAYCLGLISDSQKKDLNIIRGIRNGFAHKFDMSFSESVIADKCRELDGAKIHGSPLESVQQYRKAAVRLMIDFMVKIKKS